MNIFNRIISLLIKNRYFRFLGKTFVKQSMRFRFFACWINKSYNKLDYNKRNDFHSIFAKIYRSGGNGPGNYNWNIFFNGEEYFIPLKNESLWLDWDTALSITGHDIEVKMFYEKLLKSCLRPKVFFDVGANYGTHSLLLLKHGVKVLSFEPNPDCVEYYNRLLRANSLIGRVIQSAVGNIKNGKAMLNYVEKDTWLGSIKSVNLNNEYSKSMSIEVNVCRLDDVCMETNIIPDLIKIDTEGFEFEVMDGALTILTEYKPIVVFESNAPGAERRKIFELLAEKNYKLYDLSFLLPSQELVCLSIQNFDNSLSTNFVAVDLDSKLREILAA